jgi:hypothetical protein
MNINISESEIINKFQQHEVKGGICVFVVEDKRRERPGTTPTSPRSSGKK